MKCKTCGIDPFNLKAGTARLLILTSLGMGAGYTLASGSIIPTLVLFLIYAGLMSFAAWMKDNNITPTNTGR